jgi:predicted ATPase/DNA-binding SARP family transcriptional activator
MSTVRLSLLGPPRLERDGRPVELDTRKTVALVAYLVMAGESSGGETHTREALATLLWPEVEPQRARANLRRSLSVLRKGIGGEWLVVDRETIGTHPHAGIWLDVAHFRRLLNSPQAHGHPQTETCPDCLEALAEAVELYRGDFLEGFSLRDSASFDEWQFFETESLRLELAAALERLVHALSAQEAYGAAIPYARRWLALDPLHEPVHQHLMQLYALDGQRAAALRQYQECSRILKGELDLPPSEATRSLCEQIRTTRTDDVVPLHQAPVRRHNLPAQLTPFVGRHEQVARIGELMSDPAHRLLVLTGPGGIGKTRLAIQAASLMRKTHRDSFRDGVFFVPLAPLSGSDSILAALAQAIGFSFYQGKESPEKQLSQYLHPKRMLLVLDNFEHLIDGESIRLLTGIMAAAPGIRVLVTSRARLNVRGECLVSLGGMDIPEMDSVARWPRPVERAASYSGIQLFLHSARQVRHGFALSSDNVMPIAHTCSLVQGMPLGIELAAAWMTVLEPDEIAAKIEQGLDFLKTDASDVPARQQSLRAVFDSSWSLLTGEERLAVQRLSVFRGGFDRAGAERAGRVPLNTLVALINKSWVQRETGGRFQIHEVLRQYGAERLARNPALEAAARNEHSRYYCQWLSRQEAGIKGAEQQAVWDAIQRDIENVRAACMWAATQGRLGHLEPAINTLGLFYWRGYGNAQQGEVTFRRLGDALTAGEDWPRTMARVLMWQSSFSGLLDDDEKSGLLAQRSLGLLDTPPLAGQDTRSERAHIARQLGYVEYFSNAALAKRHFAQSHDLCRGLGDRWGMAYALLGLARAARNLGELGEAEDAGTQSLSLHRYIGNQIGQSETMATLGQLAFMQSRFQEAEDLIQQSLSLMPETNRFGIAFGLGLLSWAKMLTGRFDEAETSATESLALIRDLGMRVRVVKTSTILAYVHLCAGDYGAARIQAEAVVSLAREADYDPGVGYGKIVLGQIALVEAAFAQAYQALQESLFTSKDAPDDYWNPDQSAWLGLAARGLEHRLEAWQHVASALEGANEGHQFMQLMVALAGIALLLADEGHTERALELYALASRHPFVANSRWFEDVAGNQLSALAANLPAAAVNAARERGQARDLDATVEELLTELAT